MMFQSFFMGGFECSTHKLRSGKRLDVTAATGHEFFQRPANNSRRPRYENAGNLGFVSLRLAGRY
ncbi:MAG: hypothetical protein MUE44_20570 [Oscillatoriaceae cyanobacterium Prado104]|nr:hypothetical protein [Oscillatoriaceae cyanobacterium Prado104]